MVICVHQKQETDIVILSFKKAVIKEYVQQHNSVFA